jgi:hypothetical protein
MNKTKRVAWHKRLKKRKKQEEKAHVAHTPQPAVRQTTPRR